MQIGELSRNAGVHIETIRYYERIGILPAPVRKENGRRRYDETDVQRLRFIRNARDLGFDLASVRVLMALQERPEASCEDASRIAQAQVDAVESRIVRLAGLRSELNRMIADCRGGKVAACRIMEVLAGQEPSHGPLLGVDRMEAPA